MICSRYCAVNAAHCLPLPAGMSFVDAASLPETALTVWHNVFQPGTLSAGKSMLVHGGSSGIGTMALQLARAYGITAFATAGACVAA